MPRSMAEPWLLFRNPIEGRVQDNLCKRGTGGLRRQSQRRPFGDVIDSHATRPSERRLAPHPSLKTAGVSSPTSSCRTASRKRRDPRSLYPAPDQRLQQQIISATKASAWRVRPNTQRGRLQRYRNLKPSSVQIDPVLAEPPNAVSVEGSGTHSQLAPGVPSKIVNSDVAEIDRSEPHESSFGSRFCFVVDIMDEKP